MRNVSLRFLVLFFLLSVASARSDQSALSDAGQLTFRYCGAITTFIGVPRFKDYPAEHSPRKIAKDIDWNSNKEAWSFRTRLRAGLRRGPNFNGHYTVVEFGCGSPCHAAEIVDVETGKVIHFVFGSSYGFSYRLDSALITSDEPETDAKWLDYSLLRYGGPQFFRVENGKLIHIKDLDVSSVERSGYYPCVLGVGKKRLWAVNPLKPLPATEPGNGRRE